MTFPRYPKYKDSGVEWLGEVPEGWSIKCIRHILLGGNEGIKIGPFGSQLKSDMLVKCGYKVYGQENVIADDFARGERFVTEEKFHEMQVYEIRPSDVLVTMMGTSGRCTTVPVDVSPGIMDSHLLRMRFAAEALAQFIKILIDESPYIAHQVRVLGKVRVPATATSV